MDFFSLRVFEELFKDGLWPHRGQIYVHSRGKVEKMTLKLEIVVQIGEGCSYGVVWQKCRFLDFSKVVQIFLGMV